MIRFAIFLLVLALTSTSLLAQRYGHVNFTNVLSELPGTKDAETQLEAYNGELTKQGQGLVDEFQVAVKDAEVRQPSVAPVEFQKIRQKLEAQRAEIQQFEQRMPYRIERRRSELLGPLIKEVKAAIRKVAEAGGYSMVFDTSIFNAILFAADSEDITAAVRQELGIE